MYKARYLPLIFLFYAYAQYAPRKMAYQEPYEIKLSPAFKKAVQISSIAIFQDSVYLPTEKCNRIFIGKITDNILTEQERQMTGPATEGLAYCNGYFYTSQDNSRKIYKYDSHFVGLPEILEISSESISNDPDSNNGFEGIAVVNDTTFYILQEKAKSRQASVLYKARLQDKKLYVEQTKYLRLDEKERYCDLHYRNDTLYLLHTTFNLGNKPTIEGKNCDPQNDYTIEYLPLPEYNKTGEYLTPEVYISLTNKVLSFCKDYNTNIEGITSDEKGNFYAVSDNYLGERSCSENGQWKTLLIKIPRQ